MIKKIWMIALVICIGLASACGDGKPAGDDALSCDFGDNPFTASGC